MQIIDRFYKTHCNRIIGLDILRATAILLVVYGHGIYLLPERFGGCYFKYIISIDGVSIFFVLSGFLIGGILLRIISKTEFNSNDLLIFWVRRWFRTIPNYLIVLLVIVLCRLLIFKDFGDFSIKYIFFLQNFSTAHPNFFPEAWSLSIEEWFYLLFPLSCYFFHKILKNKSKSILYSALIFLLVPMILRIIIYQLNIVSNDLDGEIRKIVVFRLDSLMYGVFAAYLYAFKRNMWSKYKYISLLSGLCLIVLMKLNYYDWTSFYSPLYYNIESISVLLVMPYFSELKTTKIKYLDLFFIFISIISYSMYLLNLTPVQKHLIIISNILMGKKGLPIEETFILNTILYWFYTIIGSFLLYYFYESRMTMLRDRIKFKEKNSPKTL